MTDMQAFITIMMCVIGTAVTRFLPFVIFPENKETPEIVKYLGSVLPYAVIGLLVVYCLKDTEVLTGNHGVPEVIATVFIVVVHRIKKNVLLSIAGGTLLYMAMVQYIFI